MSDSDKPAKKKGGSEAAESEGKRRSRTSWILGWVGVPAFIVGLIFGAGVLVGVHLDQSWFTRLVVWIAG